MTGAASTEGKFIFSYFEVGVVVDQEEFFGSGFVVSHILYDEGSGVVHIGVGFLDILRGSVF